MPYNTKNEVSMMIFECDNFVIVGKGTLSDSEEGWSDEYSSMPQNVCERLMKGNKPVFGIFVTPNVEPNLAQQLLKATWYTKGEFKELNIMPLSTEQIMRILQTFRENKFDVKKLKVLLERFIALKKEVSNGKEWYERISEILPTF